MSFTEKGAYFLKNVAGDERLVKYHNLFLKQVMLSLKIIIF